MPVERVDKPLESTKQSKTKTKPCGYFVGNITAVQCMMPQCSAITTISIITDYHRKWIEMLPANFNDQSSLVQVITWRHQATLSQQAITSARFLSLTRSKLRLCSANHRPGYWSNLPCDWPSTAWAYSEQETGNGPWSKVDLNLYGVTWPNVVVKLSNRVESRWMLHSQTHKQRRVGISG